MNPVWLANSYAKINLGLHIKDRLENGFHLLETGLCYIEWIDRIEVRKGRETRLFSDKEGFPTDESNLILKAVRLLEKEVGLDYAYEITIDKKIPMGAGLGGGSSNAATILRMMNSIEELDLDEEDLKELAGMLGSDIPFFIHDEAAIGKGTGTEIEYSDIQPDHWIVTVYPNIESSTADAYRYFDLDMRSEYSLESILKEEPVEEWRNFLQNDLETSVFPQYEIIGNIKDQMYDFGAAYASMSGSGSSVFGLFPQDFVAIHAYESFHNLGFPANLTRPKFKPDLGIYIKETDE